MLGDINESFVGSNSISALKPFALVSIRSDKHVFRYFWISFQHDLSDHKLHGTYYYSRISRI